MGHVKYVVSRQHFCPKIAKSCSIFQKILPSGHVKYVVSRQHFSPKIAKTCCLANFCSILENRLSNVRFFLIFTKWPCKICCLQTTFFAQNRQIMFDFSKNFAKWPCKLC